MKKNKCSLKEHSNAEAIIYCQECRIFMCNKCEKIHLEICKLHHIYKLSKNLKEFFTGFCKEKKHSTELNYFCKDHNILCCAECITKIKDEDFGKHHDCNVCILKDIEEEKRNKLKDNIKILENLSNNVEESIKQLKIIFEKLSENKDNLKLKLQKIFTNIRNTLNKREDELLLDIDKYYNDLLMNELILKEGEKLPYKIKESLERATKIDNEWNSNKLNTSINDCLTIEKNIREINDINENIKKCKSKNIKFKPEEDDELNIFLENILKFGEVYYNKYSFRECPLNIKEERKYSITGQDKNIITKTGSDGVMASICENYLDKSKDIHIWKIKILNTLSYNIMVGVATIDFDINSASYVKDNNYGWYYFCKDGTLYSGPPHNYQDEETNLESQNKEIRIIMNMKKRSLKFIIDNEDKGDSYTNIPLDKPIAPSVLLYHTNDSVQITEE